MLLANYASDSESDAGSDAGPSRPPALATAAAASSKAAPVKPRKKGPVKITLDLPKASSSVIDGEGDADGDEDGGVQDISGEEVERPVKKTKIQGKGSSALLGMLPPPKRKLPAKDSKASLAVNKSMAAKPPPPPGMEDLDLASLGDAGRDESENGAGNLLMPPSVSTGKKKDDGPIDLFGLADSSVQSNTASTSKTKAVPPTSIISAPAVADYVPPEPTSNDPYPGYYQLPSGAWAAYDPDYYHSFFPDDSASAKAEEPHDGRVGKHWDEYNGGRGADLVDIDVGAGLQAGRDEQARLESMKKPKAGDDFEYKTMGKTKGLAAQRHQLTSLLSTAYSQKEELEERIASNQKNMRIARQKYGF